MLKKIRYLLATIVLLSTLWLGGCQNTGLSLIISADKEYFENIGDVVHYTLVIANIGDVFVHDITVEDITGIVTCPSTSLSPGASIECSSDYTITNGDVLAGSVVNDAKAIGHASSSCCGSGCLSTITPTGLATHEIQLKRSVSLLLTKTCDTSSYDAIGQQITYTYAIQNTGNQDVTYAISVQDDRVQVTCPDSASGLPAGGTITCSGIYTVTLDDMRAGEITNTAQAVAGTAQSDPVSLTIPIDAQPGLKLEKSADPTSYKWTGSTITYTFVVTNSGNVPLTALEIVDPQVPDIECPELVNGELAPGESVTCTGVHTVVGDDIGPGILNSAGARAKYGELTVPSNIASVSVIYIPFIATEPPVEATEPPEEEDPAAFCYQITDIEYCLSLYPVCTIDSQTELCKPGP